MRAAVSDGFDPTKKYKNEAERTNSSVGASYPGGDSAGTAKTRILVGAEDGSEQREQPHAEYRILVGRQPEEDSTKSNLNSIPARKNRNKRPEAMNSYEGKRAPGQNPTGPAPLDLPSWMDMPGEDWPAVLPGQEKLFKELKGKNEPGSAFSTDAEIATPSEEQQQL